MPSVAVRSRPKGLPIAIATSPTCTSRESARRNGLTPAGTCPGSISTTARSLDGSVPRTCPSIESPSAPNRTSTRSLPCTTWAFVTTRPVAVDQEAGAGAAARPDRDDGRARARVDGARASLSLARLDGRAGRSRQGLGAAAADTPAHRPGLRRRSGESRRSPPPSPAPGACGGGAGRVLREGRGGAAAAAGRRLGRLRLARRGVAAARRASSDCSRQSPVQIRSGARVIGRSTSSSLCAFGDGSSDV